MTRVGCIVRADGGGLASATYEVWRHVQPAQTLVVDLGPNGRGGADPSRFEADWTTTRIERPAHPAHLGFELDRFLAECDVAYTCETFYDPRTYDIARNTGTRLVLHVMPELFDGARQSVETLWAPTDWEADRLPERAAIVPIGVAHDRLPYRARERAEVFFHTTGEAMCDRNGTRIVAEAAALVTAPCLLYVSGGPPPSVERWQEGRVTYQWLPPVDDYTKLVPEDVDVMLMPRRYAGLSLPVQEAAARGVPTLMTDVAPQNRWFGGEMLVAAHRWQEVQMKGGTFDVFTATAADYARSWSRLIETPALVERASDEAYAWSLTLGWDVWGDRYRQKFEQIAAA